MICRSNSKFKNSPDVVRHRTIEYDRDAQVARDIARGDGCRMSLTRLGGCGFGLGRITSADRGRLRCSQRSTAGCRFRAWAASYAAGLDIAVLPTHVSKPPTFTSMATPISICIPHQLGRAEARRRIEDGFSNLLRQLPGSAGACTERWDGDRLIFSVSGLGQTVAGVIEILDAAVTMELELSGLLGAIASSLKGRLQEAGRLLLTRK